MIIEEDIYLEHFGVKGMQWGVRNTSGSKSKSKPKLTAAELRARKKRINSNVNKALAVVVVASYASTILNAYGSTRTSAPFPGDSPRRTKSAKDLINARRNVEVSSLNRMHREGHMDASQLKNFSAILNARYDRRIAEALRNA
ncbi:MAG: hypothetical protein H0U49_05750 [Parachlamydiaceae bacterium]|nr:hypothetical protein [Parachlamydiaceae bacterium]